MGIFNRNNDGEQEPVEIPKPEPEPEPEPMLDAKTLATLAAFAKMLKAPSEEEQAKIDADKKRRMDNQMSSVESARQQESQKEANERACGHMKGHPYVGRTRIVAPLHSDGLHHPLCLLCHKEFLPFAPGNDTIPLGSSFDDYTGITPQIVESWGRRHAERMRPQVEIGA